jgi:predicted adenine nucleotide alpha hydrolase (AANH) superfamily ATPase
MKKIYYFLFISLAITFFSSCVTVRPTPSVNNINDVKQPVIIKKRTVLFYNPNYRQYRHYNRYYYKPYYRNKRH